MVIFQIVVSLVSLGVLVYALSCWNQRRMAFFAYLALAVTLNVSGYFLEVTSSSLYEAMVSTKVSYLGAPFTGVLLYLFSRDFVGKARVKRYKRNTLLSICAFFSLTVLAYPFLPIFYSDFEFIADGVVPHVVVTPGPLYYPCFMFAGFFVILALVNLCQNFLKEKRYEGAPIFLIAIFLPFVSQICALFGLINGWSPVSAALTLSMLFLAIFLFYYRQAEWQSIGRDLVVQEMQDAFILIDNKGVIVDSNQSAQDYFPDIAHNAKNKHLTDYLELPINDSNHCGTFQFDIEKDGRILNLKVTATPLEAEGKITGSCIIINDDTANTMMVKELSRLARQDELTGLNNRATFFHDATYSYDLTRRQGERYGCALMMDIDFFKNVNDTYGHSVGDEVLRYIGDLMIKRFRKTDICGRYGGEELCVWMPATHLKGAVQVAEELRTAVGAKVFTANGTKFNVTISIGIACMSAANIIDFEDLIKKADFALYEAKHSGRNVVCTYSSATVTV